MKVPSRHPLSRLGVRIGGLLSHRRAFKAFARSHGLTYFGTLAVKSAPVIRGTTVSPDHVDTNYCIGSHAGYDMAVVERVASAAFEGYKTTSHHWYVVQIDLKHAQNLPFIFIGTRQQTKAYYARVLTSHREIRHLTLAMSAKVSARFHGYYIVLASPAVTPVIYRLLTPENMTTVATHRYPFAVEIDGDSLIISTEVSKPSQQLLDKLLHYGLWLAKEIDSRLA